MATAKSSRPLFLVTIGHPCSVRSSRTRRAHSFLSLARYSASSDAARAQWAGSPIPMRSGPPTLPGTQRIPAVGLPALISRARIGYLQEAASKLR